MNNQFGQGMQPGISEYGQAMQPGVGQHGNAQHGQNPQNAACPSKKSEKLSLSIVARDLPNVAGAFKGISDPYATVTVFSFRSRTPTVLGKTEAIKNNLSPNWVKPFLIDYELGTSMNVVVTILDEVSKGKHIKMGSASFDLNALVGAPGNTMAVKMKKGGKIIVRVDKAKGTGTLRLKINGSKLKNVEDSMFGKSDPFFELMRKDMGKNGFKWNTVYRSDVVKDNLNPSWKVGTIDLSTLCLGDLDAPLMLTVFDYEKSGQHIYMGQVETTVNSMKSSQGQAGFVLMNKKGKKVGELIMVDVELSGIETHPESRMAGVAAPSAPPMYTPGMQMPGVQMVASASPIPSIPMVASAIPVVNSRFQQSPPRPSFADYLSGGVEMQLSVAIDFTGSNGDPRKPGTLHYVNPDGNTKNDYEKAIMAIGGVLANYDTDKQFPVWGFGAKYNGQLYHLFQCGATAEVEGVSGILDAYHNTFKSGLVMSSPTDITQVISAGAALAKKGQDAAQRAGQNKYSILLILTDGAVSDINATLATLRASSDAPLSIVIVGIGNADFSDMQKLDDRSSGRDIVQFVEFNAYKNDPYGNSLAQATLQEIPEQLVGYFQGKGIQPSSSVRVAEEDIQVQAQEEEIDLNFDIDPSGNIAVSGGFVPVALY